MRAKFFPFFVLAAALFAPLQAQSSSVDTLKLLAFGDSLFAGYGLQNESEFLPAKLEAALEAKGHAVDLINAGVSGDTTAGGKDRLEWSLFDAPDGVLLELGANDALRGLPLDEARANLDAIILSLKERSIPVLLVGMRASPSMGPEYQQTFDAIFPDLAAKHDVPLYPFLLEGVAALPALNQADGLHPNAEGVDIIVERILPYVEELLEQIKTR